MVDDMIGKTFGILKVLSREEDDISPSGGRHRKYLCECGCGSIVNVFKEHLTSGRQRSCGCLKKNCGHPTHREIHTRLYQIWGNMVNRCTNPNNPAWKRYGGRGIGVCREWIDYTTFSKWAKQNGYKDSLSIDRIDNDGNYCPENCRWVGVIAQANNKNNNHLVIYNGETKTISEWSRLLGIPYKTLHRRIVSLGWEIERAFTQPLRKQANRQTNI